MTSSSFRRQLRTGRQALACVALVGLMLSGCKGKDQGDGAPPAAQVVQGSDMNLITIDSKDVSKFPLASAGQVESAAELTATGTVFPDIAREVPVIFECWHLGQECGRAVADVLFGDSI